MPGVFESPIYVTRPYLPPLADYCSGLQQIWDTRWLTNEGPVLARFHGAMVDYLGTSNLSMFNNGTLALQIGLQALRVGGEVITTPFSFVATTHSLFWNRIRPVFVDIEPEYYTLDPGKVEAAITPFTTAILAVHVYGHPCLHDELESIARRHSLRLIYDAAHAFGVRVGGRSIGEYGDLSMFSFHATKLFHSLEGGMLVFANPLLKSEVDYLKNFGFLSEVEVVMPGTNAKMNEMQALMGYMMLAHLPEIIAARGAIYQHYRERLRNTRGIRMVAEFGSHVEYNFSYVPIEVDADEFGATRDEVYGVLRHHNVFARRYFYPLICDFACYRNLPLVDPLTTARRVADRILSLPIYPDLPLEHVDRICDIIESTSKVG